jgi:hypothetical protein
LIGFDPNLPISKEMDKIDKGRASSYQLLPHPSDKNVDQFLGLLSSDLLWVEGIE